MIAALEKRQPVGYPLPSEQLLSALPARGLRAILDSRLIPHASIMEHAELLRLVDKLGQSRRYIAYLKLHRTELRRLSTRTVLARRAAEIPLADLAPPLTRPTESPEARAAVDELIRGAEAENTAVAWEAVEEVLARDNSAACAPSLDDEGIVEDDVINLEVELALEHLEALACRAEMSGAFSSLRRQV